MSAQQGANRLKLLDDRGRYRGIVLDLVFRFDKQSIKQRGNLDGLRLFGESFGLGMLAELKIGWFAIGIFGPHGLVVLVSPDLGELAIGGGEFGGLGFVGHSEVSCGLPLPPSSGLAAACALLPANC